MGRLLRLADRGIMNRATWIEGFVLIGGAILSRRTAERSRGTGQP
ncbi:hypothetical protein [Rhodoglobus sp.]